MPKKTKPVCRLHTILEEPTTKLSLEKLIGSEEVSVPPTVTLKKHVLEEPASLDTICLELESLDDENAMEDFIDKYSSATFTSLDELLANHATHPYEFQVKASTSEKLFEGLEGLFED